MSDPIIKAREDLIAQREEEGMPYNDVVVRGIRSGQWDGGDLIKNQIKKNKDPLQGE